MSLHSSFLVLFVTLLALSAYTGAAFTHTLRRSTDEPDASASMNDDGVATISPPAGTSNLQVDQSSSNTPTPTIAVISSPASTQTLQTPAAIATPSMTAESSSKPTRAIVTPSDEESSHEHTRFMTTQEHSKESSEGSARKSGRKQQRGAGSSRAPGKKSVTKRVFGKPKINKIKGRTTTRHMPSRSRNGSHAVDINADLMPKYMPEERRVPASPLSLSVDVQYNIRKAYAESQACRHQVARRCHQERARCQQQCKFLDDMEVNSSKVRCKANKCRELHRVCHLTYRQACEDFDVTNWVPFKNIDQLVHEKYNTCKKRTREQCMLKYQTCMHECKEDEHDSEGVDKCHPLRCKLVWKGCRKKTRAVCPLTPKLVIADKILGKFCNGHAETCAEKYRTPKVLDRCHGDCLQGQTWSEISSCGLCQRAVNECYDYCENGKCSPRLCHKKHMLCTKTCPWIKALVINTHDNATAYINSTLTMSPRILGFQCKCGRPDGRSECRDPCMDPKEAPVSLVPVGTLPDLAKPVYERKLKKGEFDIPVRIIKTHFDPSQVNLQRSSNVMFQRLRPAPTAPNQTRWMPEEEQLGRHIMEGITNALSIWQDDETDALIGDILKQRDSMIRKDQLSSFEMADDQNEMQEAAKSILSPSASG